MRNDQGPAPSEREESADTPERRDEEDAMRGPGHDDPGRVVNPKRGDAEPAQHGGSGVPREENRER